MAEQTGMIRMKGTVAGVCFFKLNGKYYARKKSSLSSKRVKKDPSFHETMKYAGLFAKASVIGSTVYQLLQKEKRGRKVYQQLTGKAMKLLKEGLSEKEVMSILKLKVRVQR